MDAVAVVGNHFVVNYLKDAASSLQLFEMSGRPLARWRCRCSVRWGRSRRAG